MNKEHHLQSACIKWFRLQHRGKLIYAIPNGGMRNKIVAAKLKEEGVTAGVPDLHIPISNRFYHGLYIEMKVKPNSPTELQKQMMKQLQANGYKCSVCYSLEDFQEVVNQYLKDV